MASGICQCWLTYCVHITTQRHPPHVDHCPPSELTGLMDGLLMHHQTDSLLQQAGICPHSAWPQSLLPDRLKIWAIWRQYLGNHDHVQTHAFDSNGDGIKHTASQ